MWHTHTHTHSHTLFSPMLFELRNEEELDGLGILNLLCSRDVHTGFGGENWGRDHLGDLDVDGLIILKLILKLEWWAWTVLLWLTLQTVRAVVKTVMKFWIPLNAGRFWLTEELLSASLQLVIYQQHATAPTIWTVCTKYCDFHSNTVCQCKQVTVQML